MPLDRRILSTLDTDTAPESVENGRAAAMRNMQPERGYGTTLRGNVALPAVALPAGINTVLDAVGLPSTNGGVAWLVWNSTGAHSLVRQLPGAAPRVLLTWAGLNLPAPGPATYLAITVVENFFLYLDADGEIRNLPMHRLAAGEFPATRLAAEPGGLHVVKVPPQLPLLAARINLNSSNPAQNLLLVPQKAWQFTYRYQYVDGETTVLAPFSAWLDMLELPAVATTNAIQVELPTPPAGVRELELLVRTPGDVGWRVVEALRRDALGAFPRTYAFFGLSKGGVVEGDDAERPFEFLWPARALTAARNRLWYGHPRVGYPTPEPAFTAVIDTGGTNTVTTTLYTLTVDAYVPGQPSQNGEPVPDVLETYTSYFALASGSYPDPASTYAVVTRETASGVTRYRITGTTLSYADAFDAPVQGDEVSRQVTQQQQTLATSPPDQTTFHENSTYRVAVQFYDALGRTAGVSQSVTVYVPKQDPNALTYRSIRVTLTTTDAAALNREIPTWAKYYQFVVAPNDRTPYFLQGRAADVLGYIGHKTVRNVTNGDIDEVEQVVDAIHTKHEKLLVDIGNWPATGLGYKWTPGDQLRFLTEDRTFTITDQRGDYLEVPWNGYPDKSTDSQGNTQARIEIFRPRTVASDKYYERGPRLAIVRTGSGAGEQRSYAQPSVVLAGDCFLSTLLFPLLDRTNTDPKDPNPTYLPPTIKTFKEGTPVPIECMVPPARLAPSVSTTTVVLERQQKKAFDGFFGIKNQESVQISSATVTAAQTGARQAASLTWLDVTQGGRSAVQIPLALQQVDLPDTFGFSAQYVAGTLLNGLSTWQAEDQQALAREQGAIQALASAEDVQSEDQNLVAVCTQGAVSIGINVARARQASGGSLTVDTSQVVGYLNSLAGRFGTRHPRSVRARGGRLYWWCADQAEVCRYAKDGTNDLNTQKQCRRLGAELAAAYPGAVVTAGYDSFSKEYLLCFGADPGTGAPARTVRYSDRAQGFVGDTDLLPEALVGTETRRLLVFRAGQAWEHTEGAPRNTFFGVAYPAEAKVWANAVSSVSKTFLAYEAESGPERWSLTRAETPSGQYTYVPDTRLERLEDRWHGALLMDATSPGFTGTDAARRALYEGVPVQGLALLLSLRCDATAPTVRLNAVGIEYFINGGQQPPQ